MLDDLNVRYVLQAERMGHEVPECAGSASTSRPNLTEGLQRIWEASLDARVRLSERSAVPLVDGLLASRRKPLAGGSAPKIGH
jgi:hypothetical protein